MQSYDVRAISSAPPSAVWSALLDSASWTTWAPMDELVTAKSTGGLAQVGTLRTFRTGSVVATERVTSLEPLRRMDYEGVENPQLRDYQASIELEQTPAGGTAIHWYGRYRTRPSLGLLMRWYLPRFMQKMASGLAAYAHQLSPDMTP
jgi:hypothetical protein